MQNNSYYSNSVYTDGRSSIGASTTARSDKDAEDFVRYLLQGSGATEQVDFTALRSELETQYSNSNTNANNSLFETENTSVTPSVTNTQPIHQYSSSNIDFTESPIRSLASRNTSTATTKLLPQKSENMYISDASVASSASMILKTQSNDAKQVVIQFISKQLVSLGFSPLHPSIYMRENSQGENVISLSSNQLEHLKGAFMAILEEYNRRGESIRNLQTRISDVENVNHELRSSISSINIKTKETDNLGTNDDLLAKLQETKAKLQQSRNENINLLNQGIAFDSEKRVWLKQSTELKKIIATLKKENEEMQSNVIKSRQRDEKVLADISSSRNISTNHQATLGIINLYETKISALVKEIDQLKLVILIFNSDRNNGVSDKQMPIELNEELNLRTHEEKIPKSNNLGLQSLQARLDAMNNAYNEVQNENEILKLKLLESKKSDWLKEVVNPDATEKLYKTRDLINRDKKIWKLKLFKLDVMEIEECRELIKQICSRLSIPDIDKLDSGLDTIETVIKLVPQMEYFIREIDKIVRKNHSSKPNSVTEGDDNRIPQKITALLDILSAWGKSMAEYDDLKSFKSKVHSILNVLESNGSDLACLKNIAPAGNKEISNTASDRQTEDSYINIINHFRDLFEVRSSAGVIPKMNELYVFWAEVNAGLGRLKDVLKLDSSAQPGRILIHASEALDDLVTNESPGSFDKQQDDQEDINTKDFSIENSFEKIEEEAHVHIFGFSPEIEEKKINL